MYYTKTPKPVTPFRKPGGTETCESCGMEKRITCVMPDAYGNAGHGKLLCTSCLNYRVKDLKHMVLK